MRIGILTGGGDVPGLNPVIKAFTARAREDGHSVLGLRRGWASVLNIDPDDPRTAAEYTVELDRRAVRTIDRTGGTILHTSRTNPGRVDEGALPAFLPAPPGGPPYDLTAHAVRVVEHLGLDALVAVGGDDTLSYALRMHEEGVPVAAVPKTMDNDVPGTDYCLGFSTALTRSVTFINRLRSAAGSHERVAVVELFGRYSGETSLMAGYLASADRTLIAEAPFDVERLAELLASDRAANPSRYAVAVVSEGASLLGGERVESGAADAYGHRKLGGVGEVTGALIKEITGFNILNQRVGYLMRSGPPDVLDLMVGFNFGTMAAEMVLSGVRGHMTAVQKGVYTANPLSVLAEGARRVDVDAFYDAENYRPRIRALAGKPMFLY